MMKRKLTVSIALIVIAALTICIGITVFAVGNDSTSTTAPDTTAVATATPNTATVAPEATAAPDTAVATATPAPGADANAPKDGDRCGRQPLTDAQKAEMKANMDAKIKAILDQLVADSKITQAEADTAYQQISQSTGRIDFSTLPQAVQDALKAQMDQKKPDIFANLTDAQRTAIQTTMDASLKTALQALVANNTLTQAQADAIVSHTKGALNPKDLTTVQKDAIKGAMDTARTDAINTLTQNGTLTADQAAQLAKMPQRGGHMGPGGCQGRPDGDKGMRQGGCGKCQDGQQPTATATPQQ